MSNSEKSKKGFSIGNIRRKVSFKRGNSGQPSSDSSVVASVDGGEINQPQSLASVDGETMAQDREKIVALEKELEAARQEVQKWEKRAAQYENVSADLDDGSFDAAQAFQLKKELTEIRKELAKHDKIKQELADTKQDLAEIRAQNEELQLQQSRKSTRTDIQRIRIEKTTREEVERLHRELRQMERNAKSQTSLIEAQLKASKDSLQRAGEKAQALQRRLDLVDKERMDLKLENQRLSRKIEKADSYAEKKRAQLEAESQQMEIANLKRKTVKLEKRLSMSTMNLSEIDELGPFNFSSPPRADSRTDSSGPSSPIPMTLSEARVGNLEKEVHALEERNSALENENETLKDELSAAQQKATILISQVEGLQTGIGADQQTAEDVLTLLPQYQNAPSAATSNGDVNDDALVQQLQQEITKLKTALENKEMEMRVRLKEMKATNEELKRQVEELEMEKMRLELGEDEEDLTDTEEDAKPAAEGESEVRTLRDRLMSLQDELLFVSRNNDELKTKLDKQKEEADLFVQSIESELTDVQATEEEKTREQRLTERNEELKTKLSEVQEMYNDMIRETGRLKTTITEQDEEIILLKVQKEQTERKFSMRKAESASPTKKEPPLVNGDGRGDGDGRVEQTPPPQPPPEKEKSKAGKKSGGIQLLSYKKNKSSPPPNEVDGGPPPQQKKTAPPTKKRPPREWPPKPKKK
jgi:chromosome segregation ATPase